MGSELILTPEFISSLNVSNFSFLPTFFSDQEDVNGGHSQKVIQGICDGLFGTTVKIPIVVDASLLFPSLKELQASYCELFGSSLYHTSIDYWASDSTWLSKVDNSRYLLLFLSVLSYCP